MQKIQSVRKAQQLALAMMYFLTFDMFFHRLQEPEHKKIGQSPNLIRRKKDRGDNSARCCMDAPLNT